MKQYRYFIIMVMICQLSIIRSQSNSKAPDSLFLTLKGHTTIADSVLTMGDIVEYYMYNNSHKGIEYADNIIAISAKKKYGIGLATGNFLKANCYKALQKEDSAMVYYKETLKISGAFKINTCVASALANISVIEGQNGNYAKAISLMDSVAKINLRENDFLNYGVTLNNRAYHFYEQGDFVNAMSGFKNALSVLDTINKDIFRKADVYRNIAKLNYQEKDFQDALKYFNEAMDIYKEVDDFLYQAIVWNDIGNVALAANNYKGAIDYYQKSLDLCKIYNFNSVQSKALTNIGIAQRELGQYSKALSSFRESDRFIDFNESMSNNIIYHYHIGYTYGLQKQKDSALYHLDRAIHLADSTGQDNELKNALEYRSKTYELFKMDKKSLTDIHQMISLKDSLFNISKTKQIEQLQIIFETEKKEAQIALQKEQINTLNEKAKVDSLTKGLYAGGMFTFLAVSGLLFFGFRQRMKKNRLAREKQEEIYKQEIVHKQKELASQTLHLVQKNTFIQEVMENLENIKNSPEKFKMEFRRIIMLLKKENASDKDWEVFKTYFAEVHNDFDQKLKTLYADISEKEVRLAAFLRMNLTTKEIAATLNVLPDSILKSKYRLKKKLGLEKETDLSTFLNTL